MEAMENVPWSDSADAKQQRAELLNIVRACVNKLPLASQRVLALCDIQGLPAAETAKILDLSTASVEERVALAREALRALIEPSLRAGQCRVLPAPGLRQENAWRWCERPRARGVTGWGHRIRRSVHPRSY
jgi:Sigma-70, region 4